MFNSAVNNIYEIMLEKKLIYAIIRLNIFDGEWYDEHKKRFRIPYGFND